ncbi:hypothetical protein F2Q68_00009677 [Brassica cretica]|uniref:Uncharacterized protein n=1 Tax=Brassica cretica TaxID=69181 RepID=A0A8S9KSY3_BRACR|nr:hypothetical protein F2Q68_00009677 [Brassica cretica]
MHGFVSYRHFGKARSLCNDRNVHVLGRFGSSSVANHYKEKSRARFIALPVVKSHCKVFDFLKNCGVCVGAVAVGVVLPALLRPVCYGLQEIALKRRRECMDSCRIDVSGKLDRFVTTEACTCSVALARARSLRSDRPGRVSVAM